MRESYFEHRERIRSLIQHGQLWVRHNFFFGAELAGARAAKRELTEAGYQYATTAQEGDDGRNWHLIVWGWTDTDGAVADDVVETLRRVAAWHGGEYLASEIVMNADGSLPNGREPLTDP